MRRVAETGLVIDLYSVSYRQDLQTAKSQNSGVFRDTTKGLRILSVSRLYLLLGRMLLGIASPSLRTGMEHDAFSR